jgi:hypothetical protein
MRALRHRTCRLTGATIRMSSGCIDLGAGVKFGNESKVGFTVEAKYIKGSRISSSTPLSAATATRPGRS